MNLEEKIIEIASKKKKFKTSDIVKGLGGSFSRQYISTIINNMAKKGLLLRTGKTTGTFYALPEYSDFLLNGHIMKKFKNDGLKEHEVLQEIESRATYITKLKDNVRSIFTYAFSEMLNNAIEHSKSPEAQIEVSQNKESFSFIVKDTGIGVFKNIMQKRHLSSELEAIQDLLKGKTTTAPHAHSGEGIFFTSKAADIFVLESFGHRLRIDNIINDIFVEELKPKMKGTKVLFYINLNSKRHLSDIFKAYQTDPEEYAFDKTEVKIRLYTMGTVYISRSQARRVLSGLEKFKHIVMDFDKVPTVGQAFADEVFRVFKIKHPEIVIEPVNMNETTAFMVGRVEKV